MIAILLSFILGILIGAGSVCYLAIKINDREKKSHEQLKREAEMMIEARPDQLGDWLRYGKLPDKRAN